MISCDDFIDNVYNADELKKNLQFFAVFIAVFENLTDYVDNHIKGLYCENSVIKNGKINYIKSDGYKNMFCERRVDDKGNKSEVKAQFLWLMDNGAINEEEYNLFLELKECRNTFAHELLDRMVNGVCEKERDRFLKMVELYKKIDKWWWKTFDYEIFDNCEEDDIHSIIIDYIEIVKESIK